MAARSDTTLAHADVSHGGATGVSHDKQVFTNKKTKGITLWSPLFLSNWFFAWVVPLVLRARTAPSVAAFAARARIALRPHEAARPNTDRLQAAWDAVVAAKPDSPRFVRALFDAFGLEYALIGIYKIAWTFFTWAGAWFLLKAMLRFLSQKPIEDIDGHIYAVSLFIASVFSSIAIHQQYAECNRMGIKVKAAIIGLVYRKSLRVSRLRGGAGEVINILSTDVTRINDAVVNFHFLWAAFIEVALIIGISFYEIQESAAPLLGWVLILLPVQIYLGKRTNDLNRQQTATTTERVHLMSEILTAIKLIKFYAWETPFAVKISEIRAREMRLIYEGLIVKTINFAVVFSVPVLVALTCLTMYVSIGNKLTASVSFTALSVFNTLRYPFFMLPMAVKATAGALTAFSRLEAFLSIEEVQDLPISTPPEGSKDLALEINNSDFKWDGTEGDAPTLSSVSLRVPRGSRVAIVGDVGSGKSSLISALLGQIRLVRGQGISVYGSTAYMSQEAWILNMTLRDNILFGLPMDKERYKEAIRVSGLQRDLTLLLSADHTELAERGANLSGGQRQRVSLARTVYYNADIVILDDPLSAVDQHVGRHIFEECFIKHLSGKTLIVSLNQLQYLSQMDYIVFMRDGAIRSQGTYEQLMSTDSDFSELVSSHVANGADGGDAEDDTGAAPMNNTDFEIADDLKAKAKAKAAGKFKARSPKDAMASGPEVVVSSGNGKTRDRMNAAEMMELNGLSITSRNQLSIRNNRELNESTMRSILDKQNTTGISGAGRSGDVSKIATQNELSVYSMSEIQRAHEAAAADEEDGEDDEAGAIMRGKLVKEDESTSSTGMGDFISYARSGSGVVTTVLVIISFIAVHGIRISGDYWLRLWVPRVGGFSDAVYIGVYGAFAFAFALGALLRGLFFSMVTSNKAKNLHENIFDSVMHAPMSFFDMTPLGRILSAFSKHMLHVDDTMLDAAMQALQYFPLGLGALLLCSILIPWNWAPSISLVGVAYLLISVSYPADIKTKALEAVTKPPIYAHLTATLEGLFSVRAYHAQDRFDAINLERIDRNHEALFAMQSVKSFQALYLDILSSVFIYFSALLLVLSRDVPNVDSNAGLALSNALQMLVFVQWTVRMWSDVETQMSSVGQLVYYAQVKPEAPFVIPDRRPPADWPVTGRIRFENVVLKYQKFGVSVLKNVTCTIHPSEKIGIVGRTGSGKSTLLVSLLRIVESCEGKITIDDLDVSQIGLHDLRNKVAIIPQAPVMFVGTFRSNLDPFNRSTDEEIWKALDAVQLGKLVRASPRKLETVVTENGSSVSLGQRQLICIARAILSKAKILVLDEATASLDAQTDLLIQETIKKNFADLTMLTIAHRLNTIIECDRVLVMDAGRIVEFDEPIRLLDIPDGVFRGLVEQTGEAAATKLRECAVEAHEERVKRGYHVPSEPVDTSAPMTVSELAAGAAKST